MSKDLGKTQAALDAIKSQGYDDAILVLKDYIQHFPDDELANGMLASIYAQIGMFPQARELYLKILSINPENILCKTQLELLEQELAKK